MTIEIKIKCIPYRTFTDRLGIIYPYAPLTKIPIKVVIKFVTSLAYLFFFKFYDRIAWCLQVYCMSCINRQCNIKLQKTQPKVSYELHENKC